VIQLVSRACCFRILRFRKFWLTFHILTNQISDELARSMDKDISLEDYALPVEAAVVVPVLSYPNAACSSSSNASLNAEQVRTLSKQGFPSGLIAELGSSRGQFPRRYWIVDNSGSMRVSDVSDLKGPIRSERSEQCDAAVSTHLASLFFISSLLVGTATARNEGSCNDDTLHSMGGIARHCGLSHRFGSVVRVTNQLSVTQ
jgi:hypothetical protein